jgi:enediyne biosynthesis protein E4
MTRYLLCIVVLAGCTAFAAWRLSLRAPTAPPAAQHPPWFEDVTDSAGIDFVHDAGTFGSYHMTQVVGSGVAWLDCDGDGKLDLLFLVNNSPDAAATNRLYRQTAAGKFEDVTKGSGVDFAGPSVGVAVGDVNNDGRPDVLVTQVGGVRLLLNLGGGKFRDVTAEAGVVNPLWATSANFFDYDRDGRLDLIIANYVDYDPSVPCLGPGGQRDYCSPKTFVGTVSKLFRNLGVEPLATGDAASSAAVAALNSTGTGVPKFRDVTIASGLAQKPGPGLGVFCADFTGDDLPDILIANDGLPNHLWVQHKGGVFAEEANIRGIAVDAMGQAQANMGIAIGDVNRDGLLDVFVSHLTEEKHTLWLQGPVGLFQDRTAHWKLTQAGWRSTGFGTVMGDFDNDGAIDIALVNGRVARGSRTPNDALGPHLREYSERNQLFRNTGDGFEDVSESSPALCGVPNVARGLAWADYDDDGRLDLVVTVVGGPARLLRNVAPPAAHWLTVRAVDGTLKRDVYGAAVTVHAGKERWVRVINPGDSYLCSSDCRAHFGLGDIAAIDAVEVRWPDGKRERFPGGAARRVATLTRGQGEPLP